MNPIVIAIFDQTKHIRNLERLTGRDVEWPISLSCNSEGLVWSPGSPEREKRTREILFHVPSLKLVVEKYLQEEPKGGRFRLEPQQAKAYLGRGWERIAVFSRVRTANPPLVETSPESSAEEFLSSLLADD